jgi:hypothetical protein
LNLDVVKAPVPKFRLDLGDARQDVGEISTRQVGVNGPPVTAVPLAWTNSPWQDFSASTNLTLRNMTEKAVSVAYSARVEKYGININKFLDGGRTEGIPWDDYEYEPEAFPTIAPTHVGRFHEQWPHTVGEFANYTPGAWYNDVNIALFLRSLAWMQHDRLARGGEPIAHLVSVQWSQSLFGLRPTGQATTTTRDWKEEFVDRKLPMKWFDIRKLQMKPNINEEGRIRQTTVRITDLTKYHSAVFPINYEHQHWITVVASNNTATLHLYDFLGGGLASPFETKVLESIAEFLNKELEYRGLRTVSWRYNIVITAPLQRDGSSCGPLMCVVAWLTAWYERAPTMAELLELCYNEEYMVSMRFWMAYSALTDKIWLPTEADFATND